MRQARADALRVHGGGGVTTSRVTLTRKVLQEKTIVIQHPPGMTHEELRERAWEFIDDPDDLEEWGYVPNSSEAVKGASIVEDPHPEIRCWPPHVIIKEGE